MSDEDPTVDWPARQAAKPAPPATPPDAQPPQAPRPPASARPGMPAPPPPWGAPPSAATAPPAGPGPWNAPGPYPPSVPPPAGSPPWPPAGPPAGYGGPPPDPPGSRRWWLLGGAVALVAVSVATTAVIMSGGNDSSPTAATGGPSSATTTPPSTTAPVVTSTPTRAPITTSAPAPAPANIAPSALPGLLLSAQEISDRLSSPGMQADPVLNTTSPDSSVTPPSCKGLWGPASEGTYNGSGYTGIAGQTVAEKPKPYHAVIQVVATFPDAGAARAFYNKQATDWDGCKFQKLVARYPNGDTDEGTVGVTANANDTMNVLISITDIPSAPTMGCERAMTVRANVIVDVRACSPTVGSAGWTIARDIGQKITGTR